MNKLPWRNFLYSLVLCILLISPCPVHAQIMGMWNFLNPEGSRLFPQTVIFPRHPGKPDPRWKSFQWHYIDLSAQEAKFRLYFYQEEDWIVQFAIPEIRREMEELTKIFKFTPSIPFSYLLFNSQREFQQANIFNISEGVQGITSTTEATMAIPYWGDPEAFRHVSTHELVHQFQVQKSWKIYGSEMRNIAIEMVPLWFIEGMAEYYSLHGMDAETQAYIRDLVLNPDPKKNYKLPQFFEMGPMSFINVYKVGQAKIDFLEKEFGTRISQKILESSAKQTAVNNQNFEKIVSSDLKLKPSEIEEKWNKYIEKNFKIPAEHSAQPLSDLEELKEVGETLDHFDLSPDGKLLVTREMNPLTGVTSLFLMDLENPKNKLEITKDNQSNLLSLYFLQSPILFISNDSIGYVIEAEKGPEIELKKILRTDKNKIRFSDPMRFSIYQSGILQASSPVFSPDKTQIAFIGLSSDGWTNLYRMDLSKSEAKPVPLTKGFYTWKTISWDSSGILASSNQTETGNFNLFRVDPNTKKITRISASRFDQYSPQSFENKILFQSWESGAAQIHLIDGAVESQLTQIKTGLSQPKLRNGILYALGFHQGRFRLYKAHFQRFTKKETLLTSDKRNLFFSPPWQPSLEMIPRSSLKKYVPFVSSRFRTDQIMGYFASGKVFGLGATVSDLMRDYSITGEFSVLGNISWTTLYLFLSIQRGRSTWHMGGYHLVQTRLDNIIQSDDLVRTYLHREFGLLGAIQYPLSHFSFLDAELRFAGVKRAEYSDLFLSPQWEKQNPGIEFMTSALLRLGYDTLVYELFTGPLEGSGILLESETSLFPGRLALSERLRLDGAKYFQLKGSLVLATQAMIGASFGEKFGNPFFVSGDDILRAYNFADDRLRGNYLFATKAEMRFPMGSAIGFPPLRGFMGADWGSIFRKFSLAVPSIASSGTFGLSFNLPPLAINLMFSYPFRVAPGPIDRPVVHFTLRYLYL